MILGTKKNNTKTSWLKTLTISSALGSLFAMGQFGHTNKVYADTVPVKSATTQATTPTTAQQAQVYTVVPGDTLFQIAQAHHISLQQLRQWNNKWDDLIHPGDKLYVSQPQMKQVPRQTTPVQSTQPVHVVQSQQATQPAQTGQTQATTTQQATPVTNNNNNNSNNYSQGLSPQAQSCRQWIIAHESSGNPEATNGRYFGLMQLDRSYLHGDYSVANQYRVGNAYVSERYGGGNVNQGWINAQKHWENFGWY